MNRKRRHLATAIAERPCGNCSACCTVLGVAGVKQPDEPCRYLAAEGGCSIYSRRPKQCVAYQCLWRAGALNQDDRPDRVGFVLSYKVLIGTFGVLDCIETREGAVEARFDELLVLATRLQWTLSVRYLHTPEGVYCYGPRAEELLELTNGISPDVDDEEREAIEAERSNRPLTGGGKYLGAFGGRDMYVLPAGVGMHRLFLTEEKE